MKEKIKEYISKIKEKGFVVKLALIPFLCGLLYAIAGSDNTPKQIRRFGIPVLLTFFVWLSLRNIWVITCLSSIGVFSIGHGVPDKTDAGSALGRFWYKIFKGNHRMTDYFVRGTKAFFFALSFLSIPVLKDSWLVYSILTAILTVSIASIAWRGIGEKVIEIGKKKYTVLYVDIITGTLFGFFVMLIVRF